jgi:pre-mRNA-splicing factor CWC22
MIPSAGGVYVPPFKMRAMLEQLRAANTDTEEHQKYMWEMLRKSINGIVNKVNTSNISHIVMELFNENLIRGKGLLARAIVKAQTASPLFTPVYAALLAAVNTKLPENVQLVIHRVIVQF